MKVHCEWCGEFLYDGGDYRDGPQHCGAADCAREVTQMQRDYAFEQRRSEAEADDFMAYDPWGR